MQRIQVLGMLAGWAVGLSAPGQDIAQIIGGRDASRGEYPWMVALVDADDPDTADAQFCGGTLVHPSWVITAAHCVSQERPGDLEVIVGGYDLDDQTVARTAVDAILVHPDFDPWTFDCDIALLHLAGPVAQPWIPMISDPAMDEDGLLATILGWGSTNAVVSRYPSILQETEVPIVSNATANEPWSYDGEVTANMLAAGNAGGGEDTCDGDSGGPLVTYNVDIDSWVLAGVTSWGEGCAVPGMYGVYTRVHNFRDWALGHMLPEYLAFEQAHGVAGRLHDPDLDGDPNLLEYAHRSDPAGGGTADKATPVLAAAVGPPVPAIRYRRLADTAEVFYHPEISRDGGRSWSAVDPAANQVGDPVLLDPGVEAVIVRDPDPRGHSLLRVRVSLRP